MHLDLECAPPFVAREVPAVCVWCGAWLFFGNLLGNVLLQVMGRMHGHHRLLIVVILAIAGTVAVALLAWHRRTKKAKGVPGTESEAEEPEEPEDDVPP